METLFKLVVVFFAALSTGALIINWIGLARAMSRLSSASAYVEFHQATNKTFDPYMPIVIFGALLGGIALAIFFVRDPVRAGAVRDRGRTRLCSGTRDRTANLR
jgi:hypothetical protein